MVFSSVPVYLDQPVNWHQLQQSNHHEPGSVIQNSQQLEMPTPQVGGDGGGSMIRPGSMVDRARIAKLPHPEAGLNCPRCDSTNTKFCYFNNYSPTQPRHFCKTCRRYWTRGGALRNVPVGGGCRRNKRSKNSSGSSKSQVITANMGHQIGPNKSKSGSPSSCSTDMSGHFTQLSSQLPFMASIQNLSQYNGGPIGTNIAGFQAQMAAVGGSSGLDHTPTNMGFQIGSSNNSLLPFLAGLDTPTNLFPYQNQNPAGISNEEGHVKMEDNQGLNLSRQFMGISENNQYWRGNTNTWTDQYSGVNSTSATNLL